MQRVVFNKRITSKASFQHKCLVSTAQVTLQLLCFLSFCQAQPVDRTGGVHTPLAGYIPQDIGWVEEVSRIDLDQAAFIDALAFNSFIDAKNIYSQGGHSFPVARIRLDTPLQRDAVERSTVITETKSGERLRASLLVAAPEGALELVIAYPNRGETEPQVLDCDVGGSVVPFLDGCLHSEGIVTVGGLMTVGYKYDPEEDNSNLFSLAKLNTASEIFLECKGCPLDTHKIFFNYYDDFLYGDSFIRAALEGSPTAFERDNIDFGQVSLTARAELLPRLTVYINSWIYVTGSMELALKQCLVQGDEMIRSWEQAVAVYVGSQEGVDGRNNGHLLYHLADSLCSSFGTCTTPTEREDAQSPIKAVSRINQDILNHFQDGRQLLERDECDTGAKEAKNAIVQAMTVPLIQGILLYSFRIERKSPSQLGEVEGQRDLAVAFAFSKALLPLLNVCSPSDAQTVQNILGNLETSSAGFSWAVGSFARVRESFQNNYKCLGVSCEAVGDLFGAFLCGRTIFDEEDETSSDTANDEERDSSISDETPGTTVGSSVPSHKSDLGALAVLLTGFLLG